MGKKVKRVSKHAKSNIAHQVVRRSVAINTLRNDTIVAFSMNGIPTRLTVVVCTSKKFITDGTLHNLVELLCNESVSIPGVYFLDSVTSEYPVFDCRTLVHPDCKGVSLFDNQS